MPLAARLIAIDPLQSEFADRGARQGGALRGRAHR
jgi:hypothetical protein